VIKGANMRMVLLLVEKTKVILSFLALF